jgi:putative oxidoreductase
MKSNKLIWIAQVIVFVILGQTLFFKFSDHPDTVALFSQLGMGAFGYKFIGALELVACVLLLLPGAITWGALLGWGLMSGAIVAHVTKIGFEGSYGPLGALAIVSWLLCALILYVRRREVPFVSCLLNKCQNEPNP